MTDIKVVVFDLDGTLVDSQASIVNSMRAAFRSEGLKEPSDRQVRQVIGLSLDAAIRQIAPEAKGLLNERLVAAYKDAYWELHVQQGEREELFDGVPEILHRLDELGYLLAVATGKGRRGLRRVLESHGIIERFVSLQCADDAPSKPDPTMLRQALFESGAEAENAVMVGDTLHDLRMANNAGVKSIGVEWGYHDTELLLSASPNAIIGEFDELEAVVSRLLPR